MCLKQEDAATVLTPVKKKIKNVGIFLKVAVVCVSFSQGQKCIYA